MSESRADRAIEKYERLLASERGYWPLSNTAARRAIRELLRVLKAAA